MKIFLLYLFLFLVGCVLGWFIEVIYRRFFSAKRWVNPGFMKGPWLPLYGSGIIVMFSMCLLCVAFLPANIALYNPLGNVFGRAGVVGPSVGDLIPISLMWMSMVLLEFFAGLIFIKGFKVKLWDYSNMKGNILGIVCPVFTAIWLGVAVIYYYGINPFLYELATNMYTYMFGGEGAVAHFGFIFSLGLGYGIMIYDFVTSIGLFHAITSFARRTGIVQKYDEIKEKIAISSKEGKQKVFNSLPKSIQDSLLKSQNKEESVLKKKINEAIYIDPEKEKKPNMNYDESGRPIKTED